MGEGFHFDFAAEDEGGALVDVFGGDVEDVAGAVSGHPSGLFGNEGEGVGFVHEAEFAGGVLARWWI